MAIQLRDLFVWYELLDKAIAYVKDEGAKFEHPHYNIKKYCILYSLVVATTLCYHLLWACNVNMLLICY
jgi:hypothetical protein